MKRAQSSEPMNKPTPEAEPSEDAGVSTAGAKLPNSVKELTASAPTGNVLTTKPTLSPSQSVSFSPVRHQFLRAMGSRKPLHADDDDDDEVSTTAYAVRPPRGPPTIAVVRPDTSPLGVPPRSGTSTTSVYRPCPLLPHSPRQRNASACFYSSRHLSYTQHLQQQQHQQRYPVGVQSRRRFTAGGAGSSQQTHWRPSSLSLTRINDDSRFLPLREVAAANTVSVPDLTKMPLRSALKGSRNHSSLSLNQAGNSTPHGCAQLQMTVSVSAHNIPPSSSESSPNQITEVSSAGAERNGGSRWRFRDLFQGAFLSTSPKRKEPTLREESRVVRTLEAETHRESLFFPSTEDAGDEGTDEKSPSAKTSHRYSEMSTCIESLKPIFEVDSTLDSPNSPTPSTKSPLESCQPPRIPTFGRRPGDRKRIISEGSEESIDEAQSLSSNEITGSPNTSLENDGNSELCPQQLMIRSTVTSLDGQAVLRFYECVSVHEIDSDFPRAAERTWLTLTPLDKALIRRELNEYKRGEMQVHPQSFGNTRFHPS
uniref:Phosphatase and actin regulator 2 n=2 Tax=Schistocephalus solidus TaxID=70667 RepID=A0A0X3P2X4_SCHSO